MAAVTTLVAALILFLASVHLSSVPFGVRHMVYVPKKSPHKQRGINNNDGEYEGIWSGPFAIDPNLIRRSHMTSRNALPARGYEDKPIRILRLSEGDFPYRIVDGNKRLHRAKVRRQPTIQCYIFEGLLPVPNLDTDTVSKQDAEGS